MEISVRPVTSYLVFTLRNIPIGTSCFWRLRFSSNIAASANKHKRVSDHLKVKIELNRQKEPWSTNNTLQFFLANLVVCFLSKQAREQSLETTAIESALKIHGKTRLKSGLKGRFNVLSEIS